MDRTWLDLLKPSVPEAEGLVESSRGPRLPLRVSSENTPRTVQVQSVLPLVLAVRSLVNYVFPPSFRFFIN